MFFNALVHHIVIKKNKKPNYYVDNILLTARDTTFFCICSFYTLAKNTIKT